MTRILNSSIERNKRGHRAGALAGCVAVLFAAALFWATSPVPALAGGEGSKWGPQIDVHFKPGGKPSLGAARVFTPLSPQDRGMNSISLPGHGDPHSLGGLGFGAGNRTIVDRDRFPGGKALFDASRADIERNRLAKPFRDSLLAPWRCRSSSGPGRTIEVCGSVALKETQWVMFVKLRPTRPPRRRGGGLLPCQPGISGDVNAVPGAEGRLPCEPIGVGPWSPTSETQIGLSPDAARRGSTRTLVKDRLPR
jgi:hypothetical protein